MSRLVIDTNVVFEGLTKQGCASSIIIDAWLADWFQICISNALAYEYTDVLSRKLSQKRWQRIQPVLGSLLDKTQFVTIYFSWKPISPDPKDEHVIDCGMNANATVITSNIKDFKAAQNALGLRVKTPIELVTQLYNAF